jgi:hypothetical protein
MGVSGNDMRCAKPQSWCVPTGAAEGVPVRIRIAYLTSVLAAGAAAVAIAAAPAAAADASQQTCTSLSTSSTKCQSPGDAEINDSLPYANVLPQWTEFGGQSGGPYGGAGGGAG